MSVDRLSPFALDKILSGKVKEEATCVVKFYSNDCHYCHKLAEYYKDQKKQLGEKCKDIPTTDNGMTCVIL